MDRRRARRVRSRHRSHGADRRGALALSRYCLDTSAYSQFKRGDPPVVDLIDGADWVGIPSVALGEIWAGFLLGNRLRQNQAQLEEFLASPSVEEILIDREISRIYAEMFVSLRKAGTPVPLNDIWIAAAAARLGVTVLTYDPHFQAIRGVRSIVLPSPRRN